MSGLEVVVVSAHNVTKEDSTFAERRNAVKIFLRQRLCAGEVPQMKSHILFSTSECFLKQIEERTKKDRHGQPTNESYWTVRDTKDVCYLIYKDKKSVAETIKRLIPSEIEGENNPAVPVRLEGYVAIKPGNIYLCLLRCLVWDSISKQYRSPENAFVESVKDDGEATNDDLYSFLRDDA